MCLVVPCRVVEVSGASATVERLGERLEVSLVLLDGPVEPGAWLAVQAQRLAVARMDEVDAREHLALLDRLARLKPMEVEA
jgi:hydrogenase assembly chaperone HypC/HupF